MTNMTVCDMHADTLTRRGKRRLFSVYNSSERWGHLQFFAHFVPARGEAPQSRRRKLMRMHAKYLGRTSREGVTEIKAPGDLTDVAARESKKSALFSIEGGGGIFADSPELITLFESGLRVFGIAWDKNELSASASELGDDDFGLTGEGVALVNKLTSLGIVPDVSHMSDKAVYDLFDTTDAPVLATHSNFRAVCEARRNLTNMQACELARRGGLIGINFYPPYLAEGGDADIYDVIRHIDYGLELVGEERVALGLDIDGTDGFYPNGFDEKSSIHDALFDALSKEYSSGTLERIFSTNVLDFLKTALK